MHYELTDYEWAAIKPRLRLACSEVFTASFFAATRNSIILKLRHDCRLDETIFLCPRCARSFAVRPGPGRFGYASAARGLSCGLAGRVASRGGAPRGERAASLRAPRLERCGHHGAPLGAPPPLAQARGTVGATIRRRRRAGGRTIACRPRRIRRLNSRIGDNDSRRNSASTRLRTYRGGSLTKISCSSHGPVRARCPSLVASDRLFRRFAIS
jgi:hypothetical protein